MKLGWVTDAHFNFLDKSEVEEFCKTVNGSGVGALLLGGDIAEAVDIESWLDLLDERLKINAYFVLGNHDYYQGSVTNVREKMRARNSPRVKWLPATGCVELDGNVGLVGHGGWGDARHGDFENSPVILNDYLLIEELRETVDIWDIADDFKERAKLKETLQKLGDDAARTLRPHLMRALGNFKRVIVLTHVPPFRDACLYNNQISDANWLPGFSCKAMGDLLVEAARATPDSDLTVLCGHTHGGGYTRILPNLEVYTGSARYGHTYLRIVDVSDERIDIDNL